MKSQVSKKNNVSKLGHLSSWVGLLLVVVLLSLVLVACGSDSSGSRSLGTPETTAVSTTESVTTTSAATTPAATSNGATTAVATTAVATTAPAPTAQRVAQQTNPAAQTDQTESNSVVAVVKQIGPAVVTVYNKSKYTPRGGRVAPNPTPGDQNNSGGYVVQGIGSGIIISTDGYIVTNNHVVDGEDDLTVALNDGKTTVSAKVVGRDKLGDIAVLKISAPVPATAKWADKAEVGETVVAIGSALGNFRNSVSKGVISGLNRSLPGDSASNVYLQTDAAINPGNSGGPLLNLRGEIVGINTAVLRSTSGGIQRSANDVAEGLGFAIPSSIARILSEQLISKGAVSRPYFGISYQMITPAEAGTLSFRGQAIPAVEGAWISRTGNGQSSVVKGGPAEKAGLKDNDVVTAINGEPLNDNNPLGNVILKYRPGDTIKLTVQRGDQTVTVDLTLAERPADL